MALTVFTQLCILELSDQWSQPSANRPFVCISICVGVHTCVHVYVHWCVSPHGCAW